MTPEGHSMKEKLRKRKSADYLSVSAIRTEIRTRRKHILGSHISVLPFVCVDDAISESRVDELSHYLADRTVCFWEKRGSEAHLFCLRFYTLAFYVLASGEVGDDLVALNISASHAEILDTIKSCTHSRLPVYEGSIDNIIGVLQIRRYIKAYIRLGT